MKVATGTAVWPVHTNKSDNRRWCAKRVVLTRDVPVDTTQVTSVPLATEFNRFTFRDYVIVPIKGKGSVTGFVVHRSSIR